MKVSFFNYTGQFQRKLRFELSIYRRDDLEDNSSSYHSAYNLLSVKIKRILTFFVVLRLRLKTQMRKLFIWIFGTKKQDFFEKVGSTKLGSSTFSKEPQAFQGTETLKSVFLFSQIFNFSFEQKKKKEFSFFGRERACLLASQKRKIGAGTSYFSQALSFLRLFEYNKRDEEIKLLSFIKTENDKISTGISRICKKTL